MLRHAILISVSLLLTACASVPQGDKTRQAELKAFQAIPDKGSLYVCRENAVLLNAGVKTTVLVGEQDIGTVTPNTFVHALLSPGKYKVQMKNSGLAAASSPSIDIDIRSNQLAFLWIGGGFGFYTIDYFRTDAEAQACVQGATYVVKGG